MSDRMISAFVLVLLLFALIDSCQINDLKNRVAALEAAQEKAR
jgi:hypothetical protein